MSSERFEDYEVMYGSFAWCLIVPVDHWRHGKFFSVIRTVSPTAAFCFGLVHFHVWHQLYICSVARIVGIHLQIMCHLLGKANV